MLLILMYHQVQDVARKSNALEQHLRYLIEHYPIVLPGESLRANEINICLTFDDAKIDFYTDVFPLLDKLNGRAIVAVPTNLIGTTKDFCTWNHLQEMQASGLVYCASHGHNHLDLSIPGIDVMAEIQSSITNLKRHLGSAPHTFIYPYGRTNREVHMLVTKHFLYAMRIGSAMNWDWSGNAGLLYRVDAENFWPHQRVWSFTDAMRWRVKYYVNRLRDK